MDSGQLKKHIVEPALLELGLHSGAALQLLMLTAAQESRLGHYIVQIGGPALGIFQMEPFTHDDIWNNFLKYKPDLAQKLEHMAGTHPVQPGAEVLVYNLKYAAAMARIHYYRVSEALPEHGDVAAMADYWKQYYNTPKGRGTVAEAVHNYHRYVGV